MLCQPAACPVRLQVHQERVLGLMARVHCLTNVKVETRRLLLAKFQHMLVESGAWPANPRPAPSTCCMSHYSPVQALAALCNQGMEAPASRHALAPAVLWLCFGASLWAHHPAVIDCHSGPAGTDLWQEGEEASSVMLLETGMVQAMNLKVRSRHTHASSMACQREVPCAEAVLQVVDLGCWTCPTCSQGSSGRNVGWEQQGRCRSARTSMHVMGRA